ncbi:COP9 SIGNALOSOME COMPLEX SUBUNIT 3-LIKE ISOFORM X1 [Salix viminalis]|uniref:COP9 SIGNALOSOME COMPLEX SUBUNIT 3-LIKE ISOFORM X1 n=1 Tax=Salix viminalis TaxID=40686 RepID=A0A9Q0NYB4_SALVM|nr:COP9 SIGNALOSOME COMPLEX SUBUNIT 3-LIKE ISOFORM X1 [Salix viminalis]
MATAESLGAQIQGLSSNVVDLSLLSTRFKKADEELHNESTRLLAFLEQLDPTLHSLGYLYILEACTSRPVTNEQARRLVLNLSRFLTCCVADQIRLTSENCNAIKLAFPFWRMFFLRSICHGTFFSIAIKAKMMQEHLHESTGASTQCCDDSYAFHKYYSC